MTQFFHGNPGEDCATPYAGMPYDLFISYSRRDNQQGQVSALRDQIEADYRSFAKEDLRCFFDLNDIPSMDDWRHRILEGLRDSNLLLLVLSPAYLDSPYCGWEIVEFLKYEHSRSVGGQGVTPVYFVEIPGLDDPGFEQRAAAWVARVRRRNQVDLRPWFHEGAEALKKADVRHRLDDLERSLHARLSKLRRLRGAPGNLPAHNPRFVGREAEMQRLHEAAGLGRFGVLTAVQGMGGVGKTALAIQYAYAYADFYPGGRWMVGCAGETSLAAAVRRLDLDLGITFSDAEKRDDALAACRVLAELERRAIEGAQARSGEKDPPRPKALLLLDNVDAPALLQLPQSDLLTGRPWLHVLATTRSGAEDFGNDPERLTVFSIDELPDNDAVRLIESYQPGGRFPSPQEHDAAFALVKLLGGFTLAVEVVAVHLGERAGRVTCAAFLERMTKEGVGKFDAIVRSTKGGVRHGEKLIGPTLKPTLDLLSEPERLVLSYAALLPPDTIPVPWLRVLASRDFPDLGLDAQPGYDDPWLSLINHLLGLRLLQTIDLAEDDRSPRLLRMHRLVGELVRSTAPNPDTLSDRLASYLETRSNELEDKWHLRQWEIPPLIAFARSLLAQRAAIVPTFMRSLCQWLPRFDYGRHSEPMLRATLAQIEEQPTNDQSDLSTTLSNLGWALQELGRHAEAEKYLRRALEIDERSPMLNEGLLTVRCNQLAGCLTALGRSTEAGQYAKRSLELSERAFGPEHPRTLACLGWVAALMYNRGDQSAAELLFHRQFKGLEKQLGFDHPNTLRSAMVLSKILAAKGDSAAAEPLCRRAVESRKRVFGVDHPETLSGIRELAKLLSEKGDYAGAEPLLRRAVEGMEGLLGPEHPDTLTSVNELARLLSEKGDYAGAEPLYRRSLEARERVLGGDHPDTLASVNDLGRLLESKGDYAGAEPLYRRALEARERVLGPEYPDTLVSVNSLACLMKSKGDYAGAEPLYRRALEAMGRVWGPEHHLTLCVVNNLASLLKSKDDSAGAESLYRRVLEARERVLGPEHPDTRVSVNNLAMLLEKRGDYAGALEARERVLGPDHPDTLASVNSLAVLLYNKGDFGVAEPLYRRALEARERVLGPDHPDTLASVNNLAFLLASKGDYADAEPLFRRVLEARARVLGPEHPDTLGSVNNLAKFRQRVIEARERATGSEPSPQLAIDLNNLALQFRNLHRLAEADSLLRRALAVDEKVRGETHPKIPHRLNNLCTVLIMQGKLDEAKPLLARAWQLKSSQHDLTSSRLLFLRLTVALLESQPTKKFVGQLKTLLALESLPDHADVTKTWDIACFIEHLRPKLPPASAEFLTALVAALNDHNKLPDLDRFPEWRNQAPIPLDAPWPNE